MLETRMRRCISQSNKRKAQLALPTMQAGLSRRKVLPEWCCHQALPYLAPLQHPQDFLPCKDSHLHILALVEMLSCHEFHVGSQETMGQIGMRAGIGRDRHPLLPLTTSKASLFQQLSLGGSHRFLALLYHSGTQLVHRLAYRITILANKHKLAFLRDGDGIHPVGIFQHIILVNDGARRQLHLIDSCREPRTLDEIFLAQRLPFHILVCHCFLLLFIYDIILNVSRFDRKNSKIIRNDKKYRKKKNAIHISTPFFWMYQIKALTLQKIARRYVDI